jgi:hypothetical protein
VWYRSIDPPDDLRISRGREAAARRLVTYEAVTAVRHAGTP